MLSSEIAFQILHIYAKSTQFMLWKYKLELEVWLHSNFYAFVDCAAKIYKEVQK